MAGTLTLSDIEKAMIECWRMPVEYEKFIYGDGAKALIEATRRPTPADAVCNQKWLRDLMNPN